MNSARPLPGPVLLRYSLNPVISIASFIFNQVSDTASMVPHVNESVGR